MKLATLKILLTSICFAVYAGPVFSQDCTTLGQRPSTAFPVCGTTTFHQTTVPLCNTNLLFVPGCSGAAGANYANRNPYFYKFTCYSSGTLGFLITPLAPMEDYDWQLYDITGKSPSDIFTDNSLVVTGNWSGNYGPTGASSTGVSFIQCGSDPATDNTPTFAAMPNLVAGREYLLMISHFTDGQSGYDLSFSDGSAVITDPLKPHMVKATPSCDGKSITVTFNKKLLCTSLTSSGSEFSIAGLSSVARSAVADSCAFGFDFDEVTISFGSSMSSGTHFLTIHNGSDVNTLLDNCGNAIPPEQIAFDYFIPQPILADSVGKMPCSPDSVLVYYPKKITCSSISPGGTDFSVSGPAPVTVTGASGNCINDQTSYIIVKLNAPVYTKGNYSISIQPGIDGSPIFDVCGQPLLPQTLPFTTFDTVSAQFSFSSKSGCQRDTLLFAHDGAHDVNNWNWIFNGGTPVTTQTHTIIWQAAGSNTVQLSVSNGVCSAEASRDIILDNEVKAGFTMPDIICPEDPLELINESKGKIDSWRWNYDIISYSTLKDPPPFLFPTINHEAYYTVKLVAGNSMLGCSDSVRKTLTVLDHCFIAVPTAFTPNNDGLNDYFSPHNALKADDYYFQVYNRWGQRIFYSRNWRDKWDGRVNGLLQTTGVYVWMLSYTNRDTKKQVFEKGTVTLIR